jgi:iron complex outermembrane receptor protein
VPESTTRNLGVFLLEDRHFDAWTLELGLRAEYQQLEPDDHSLQGQNSTSWTLSAATIWSADDYNTITMAISSSQRPPVAEELYANVGNIDSGLFVEHGATGAVEIGDPDLGKETSTNIELGWTHTGAAWDASVNLFYNYFGDYIYLGNTGLLYNLQECPGTSICDPQEVDEGAPVHIYAQQAALFRGLEAQIDIPLWPRGPYEMSLELFGDYVRATLEDSGDDVPRMPPARIGARFNYQAGPWSGFVGFLHGFEQNHAGANETATAAYTRLDLGAYYQLSAADCQWLLFVKANNLSNAEIRNSTSYLRNFAPEPGRGFELGVSLEF